MRSAASASEADAAERIYPLATPAQARALTVAAAELLAPVVDFDCVHVLLLTRLEGTRNWRARRCFRRRARKPDSAEAQHRAAQVSDGTRRGQGSPPTDDEADGRATTQLSACARRLADDDAPKLPSPNAADPAHRAPRPPDLRASLSQAEMNDTRHAAADGRRRRRQRPELDADREDVIRSAVAVGASSDLHEAIRRAAQPGTGLNHESPAVVVSGQRVGAAGASVAERG